MPRRKEPALQKGDPGTKVVARGGKEYVYALETFYFEGHQYEVTGTTRSAAIQKAERKKIDLEKGNLIISKNTTVKRWAEEYFETYKRPTIKSVKHQKNILRHIKLITDEIGAMRISDVTEMHLQKILNTREGMSHSEAKHLRDVIKGLFKKARQTKKTALLFYDTIHQKPLKCPLLPRESGVP